MNTKNLVLLVEDKPEELVVAKEALQANGLRFIAASNLKDAQRLFENFSTKLLGVITDLHFPSAEDQKDDTTPNGLSIIAKAVREGIPVAVCSDVNHHYSWYLEDTLKTLEEHPKCYGSQIPYCLDRKDWQGVIQKFKTLTVT